MASALEISKKHDLLLILQYCWLVVCIVFQSDNSQEEEDEVELDDEGMKDLDPVIEVHVWWRQCKKWCNFWCVKDIFC